MRAHLTRVRWGRPIWLEAEAPRKRRFRRFTGHRRTDVAVIGGGMTGAVIAEALARAGAGVTVLEADRVAHGSTVASSALLLQEADRSLGDLAARYGPAASARIWQLGREAVRGFVDLLRQHRIDCDLAERDVVYFAATADAAASLRRDLARRHASGFAGEWISPARLRREIGVHAFGAVKTSGHAQFDPYRACLGLLDAARDAGADVFERSRVRRVVPRADGVRVYTQHGTLDARRAIVATGYATPQFRPLAGRFAMYRTYVFVTERLSADQRKNLGLAEVMIWNTNRPYEYARWTPDGRLLVGGGDRRVKPGTTRTALARDAIGLLRERASTFLPGLEEVAIATSWEGLFALTPDSLPYIGPHRRYPGHLFALGYGGNGMTFGFLAARLLLEYWRGVQSPDQRLFAFGRLR